MLAGRRARWLVAVWLVLGIVLVGGYYRQVGQLSSLGPGQWLSETYSFEAARQQAARLASAAGVGAARLDAAHAAERLFSALWGAGVVLVAAQAVGALLLRVLGQKLSVSEHMLYRTFLGLGVVSYTLFGLATFGFYTPEVVRLLLAILAAGAVIGWVLGWRRQSVGREKRPLRIDRWSVVWLGVAGLACGVALVGALAPETEYDALWYHLWLPQVWLEAGHPVDVVTEYPSLYPLTWELLYGAAMVLGGPVAAKLLHWVCLPLGALLAAQLTARFFSPANSYSRRPAALAAALFVTFPTVLWEATTAYNDLVLGVYVGLALYALLAYHQTRQPRWLPLLALSLGWALAIKHLALFAGLLLGLGLLWSVWRQKYSWGQTAQTALLVGGLCLLLPLPWYWRSWQASGNPFFPDLYGLFGAFPAERWSALTEHGLAQFKANFGFPRTARNLALLPWNVTLHAARFGGSLGVLPALLLPGLLLRQTRGRLLGLVAFGLAYFALWTLPIGSFQLRFLVLLAPVLAVLAAVAYLRIQAMLRLAWPGKPWLATVLNTALLVLLLLNLPPFTSLHEGDRRGWEGWLTHVMHEVPLAVVLGLEPETDYLSRKIPSYLAWTYINQALPPDAYVLSFSGGDHLYAQRRRLLADATVAHPLVWGAEVGDEDQVLKRMQQMGITHILIDKQLLEDPAAEQVALLHALQLEDLGNRRLGNWGLVTEYEDERFRLVRVQVDGPQRTEGWK